MNDNLFATFFPAGFTLETPRVMLRPMMQDDYEVLLPLASSPETFKYYSKDLSQGGELKAWMAEAFRANTDGIRMPFTIYDKEEKKICGCTSYGNISFYDKRLEIGWTWLAPQFVGKGVNKHAKFALLNHAFEIMHMERVEVKTDVLNERSRAALLKVGMKPEGVLRSHMQMHSNRRRDSMYFSIIREEWGERKRRFFAELI
jgi:RimJ/RimL family protein N-acetyltransferase